jgi:zinc protease
MRDSTFDPRELAKELQVILEEWKRGEDNPSTKVITELFALAYQAHPYGRPVIGYRETIESLDRRRVTDFYRQWYRPNNMVLVIVGDVDKEQAGKEVERFFADIAAGPLARRPRPPEPAQQGARALAVNMAVEEVQLALGFHIPPVYHEDTFALDVLGFILGGGDSSRFVQDVQAEKELVNSIAGFAYSLKDGGLFVIVASLEREKFEQALGEILEETFRLGHELVSPDELSRARTNLESDFVYRQETVQGKARQLGYSMSVFGNPRYEDKYLQGLARVSREDVRRVARTYLRASNLSLVVLGATDALRVPAGADLERLCAEAGRRALARQQLPAVRQRATDHLSYNILPNGVRLLVKEHREVPVFSIRALALGGLLFESESNTGINNFLAGLLTRGTKRFGRHELTRAVESMAGSLDGFSGRNCLGLAGSFLATRVDHALDLFLEALLHPTFPEEETEKRRREVLLALKNREDDLPCVAFDLFYETLFTRHPYRFPVPGTPQTIQHLRREAIERHYRLLLAPERLVVSVVGDVDTERVVSHLGMALAGVSQSGQAPPFPPPEERQKEVRRRQKSVDRNQAHLMVGFQGTHLLSPDRYPLRVIDAILSRQGGRLFLELRERQALAYAVHAFSTEGLAPGAFGIYIGTDPSKVEQALAAALAELRRLREEPVDARELDQAKKYLVGSYEISLQSNAAQAEEAGFNELYGLGYDVRERYLEGIARVSADAVLEASQKYFDLDAYTVVVVGA